MAHTTTLPDSNIGETAVPYMGRKIYVAGDRTFNQWSIDVYNDEDFAIRNSLESWMNAINSHAGNVRNTAALNNNGYTVDATVTQYGKTGGELKKYRFVGLFPVDLAPIDLDWGSNDTIEEYATTFAYQWWEAENTTT